MAVTQIPFWVSLFFFFSLIKPSFGENDTTIILATKIGDLAAANDSFLSPPLPNEEEREISPFRPSIAVIVGVLTTVFSITFLLLLYAKHCKHGTIVVYSNHASIPAPSIARKNSGIDRAVVESLPLFRFGSLRGQKDGLECAVCLTRFEPTEVLRLLPKCKHAFHVECVDTWLDSHSTCPLCRNRVDPEDILLIQGVNIFHPESQQLSPQREDLRLDMKSPTSNLTESEPAELNPGFRRVSGRHSSAGESGAGAGTGESSCLHDPTSCRRSLDSVRFNKKSESVAVGCFDRPRKDGLLLTDGLVADRKSFERRFEHRIIVSAGFHQRWSDVQPSDMLYLRSEMIISDSHGFSLGSSRSSVRKQQRHSNITEIDSSGTGGGGSGSGSGVINTRSVSEITGLSRFSSRESNGINRNHNRERQAGLVSRWVAWMSSQSHSQPDVRSDHNTHTCNVV
ncbi:hypothetical protein ACOSQ2_015892 [Xanthoceras sorbifolium]